MLALAFRDLEYPNTKRLKQECPTPAALAPLTDPATHALQIVTSGEHACSRHNSLEVPTKVAIVPDEAANNAFDRLLDFIQCRKKRTPWEKDPHAHEVMVNQSKPATARVSS